MIKMPTKPQRIRELKTELFLVDPPGYPEMQEPQYKSVNKN